MEAQQLPAAHLSPAGHTLAAFSQAPLPYPFSPSHFDHSRHPDSPQSSTIRALTFD
jgi:hypothetical protein